jgi:hypothetical protein
MRPIAKSPSMKALPILLSAAAALSGATAPAQTVVSWNFGVATPSLVASSGVPIENLTLGSVSSFTGQTLTVNTTSSSTGYAGASGGQSGSFAAVSGSFSAGTSSAFTVTLTPAPGYEVTVASVSWGTRSTSSGPTQLALRTSADLFAADAFTTSVATNNTWSLVDTGPLTHVTGSAANPLTLRIYGYGGSSASAGNWRFDDLSVSVSMSAVPEPSTYAALAGACALLGAGWHRHWRRRKLS